MSPRYSPLSPRQDAIVSTVARFGQLSTSQLRRLHFPDGTARGRTVRSQHTLARLVQLGVLSRLTRPQGGYGGGSAEAIYQLPTMRARTADMHTLDITELYVRLTETSRCVYEDGQRYAQLLAYDPEPWSYVTVGHMELKPDAYCRLKTEQGTYRYFIEVDRGTEFKSQLSQKMRRYVRAYERWDEPTFPQVVWLAPDADRVRFIQSVVKRQEVPGLFAVDRFDEAVEKLTN